MGTVLSQTLTQVCINFNFTELTQKNKIHRSSVQVTKCDFIIFTFPLANSVMIGLYTLLRLFLAPRYAQSVLGFYPIYTEEINLYNHTEPLGKFKLTVYQSFIMTLVIRLVGLKKSPLSVT